MQFASLSDSPIGPNFIPMSMLELREWQEHIIVVKCGTFSLRNLIAPFLTPHREGAWSTEKNAIFDNGIPIFDKLLTTSFEIISPERSPDSNR